MKKQAKNKKTKVMRKPARHDKNDPATKAVEKEQNGDWSDSQTGKIEMS